MKKQYIIWIAILCLSCKRNLKDQFASKQISVQIMEGAKSATDVEYKVRIFHEEKNVGAAKGLNEKMLYHADSCFYKMNGQHKQYADAIISVPNGIKNCFEYVVVFSSVKNFATMVNYDDKYITGKTYQLSLK